MCGIVGYVGKEKHALEVLINGLTHLEYRGYDSAGIAYIINNKLITKKEKGRISNLKNTIDFSKESNIGIGHTRWATHGVPSKVNSHPHTSGHITIVHNGIIENYLKLKKELTEHGYTFKSDTDSEIAAALLDYYYNETNDMLKTIKLFKKKATGAYALAIICDDELDTLYAIKKNSPLIIGVGDKENYIASDVPAILEYTNKYITLDDYNYAKITNDKIILYNQNDRIINQIIKVFDGSSDTISKQNYEHYMLKEIHEEADIIKRNIDLSKYPDISKYKNILIVACGSAMHAGLVGKYLIEEYANIPVTVMIASEFRYQKLFLDKKTLLIAISQSGETADTLEAVKIVKEYGLHTLGIINVKESSIARIVDDVIYTEAGPEIAVATTKAYLMQVAVLSSLAYKVALKNKEKAVITYLEDYQKLSVQMIRLLDKKRTYLDIAKKIYKSKHIFYIGRGIDYAIAMEASLKIKEISYIHSEAYPAGELKHGTISLIEKGTPVFGIVTDKKIADKTISNLKEVKARGAKVIYITTSDLDTKGDFYDIKLTLPKNNPMLEPLIAIIPLQLIAYYTAKLNKCDIDKPKNLAKSVTVE